MSRYVTLAAVAAAVVLVWHFPKLTYRHTGTDVHGHGIKDILS